MMSRIVIYSFRGQVEIQAMILVSVEVSQVEISRTNSQNSGMDETVRSVKHKCSAASEASYTALDLGAMGGR
jgi:propanediol utilization protein